MYSELITATFWKWNNVSCCQDSHCRNRCSVTKKKSVFLKKTHAVQWYFISFVNMCNESGSSKRIKIKVWCWILFRCVYLPVSSLNYPQLVFQWGCQSVQSRDRGEKIFNWRCLTQWLMNTVTNVVEITLSPWQGLFTCIMYPLSRSISSSLEPEEYKNICKCSATLQKSFKCIVKTIKWRLNQTVTY